MLTMYQSEISVLGAVLINPELVGRLQMQLTKDDFQNQKNALVYQAMCDLHDAHLPILPTTILETLESYHAKEARKVDGAYLGEILQTVITSTGTEYHIGRILTNRLKVALLDLSSRIADDAKRKTAVDLLNETKDRIAKINPPTVSQPVVHLADILGSVLDDIDSHDTHAIPTGITDLDRLITGWRPGELIIVAGRPGMGKSILAKDFAEAAGVPVLFFSLEMPVSQFVQRQIAAHSGVSYTSIRRSLVSDAEWPDVTRAAEKLYRLPIAYSDKANMSISELAATCGAYKKQRPDLGMVVIDYLQLIRADGRLEHREREVSQISQRLKTMARDLDMPVICLAQLNRACETRGGDKKPMLSDLRESGSIEQDADTVLFIWREAMYVKKPREDGTNNEHDALLIVAKGRNTGTGAVKVYFDGAHQRFANLAKYSEADGGMYACQA